MSLSDRVLSLLEDSGLRKPPVVCAYSSVLKRRDLVRVDRYNERTGANIPGREPFYIRVGPSYDCE